MRSAIYFLAFVALATAKTDLSGCTSSDVVAYGGASVLYYVPGTGEICSFLDCGGGRAPPKSTVPGCPLYTGTATYSPSFLPEFKDGSAAASSTSYVAATTTSQMMVTITGTSTTVADASRQTTLSGVVSSSKESTNFASTELVTSTSTSAQSGPTSAAGTVLSEASGSGSSTSSVASSTSSVASSTSSAASSSNTSNAGASTSIDFLSHGIIGAFAAGFAFLL